MKKILLWMVAVLSVSFLSTSVFALGKNKQLPVDAMIVSASSQVQAINVTPFATGIIALNPIDPAQLGIDEAKLKNMKPEDAQKYIQEKMDAYAKIHFGTGIQAVTVTATAGIFTGSMDALPSWGIQILSPWFATGWVTVSIAQRQIGDSGAIFLWTGTIQVTNQIWKKMKKRVYLPRAR